MRLTDKEYWERVYAENLDAPAATAPPTSSHAATWLRRLLESSLLDWSEPYDDYLLWEVIFPSYLEDARGKRAIEIGSAPGKFMVRLADQFGVVPFGVEYTAAGATANRATFAAHGYGPEGVIEADVFSSDFQAAHHGSFDVVISRGFIEHFSNPQNALDAHLSLLKPGGLLVVLIPNLRGIYWVWTWLFNRAQLPLHNLEIMRMDHFRALFDPSKVDTLRCSYLGTFTFWLFTVAPPVRFMRKVLRAMILMQRGINIGFRMLFGQRGCETAWFSPNLLFVGRKCAE